MRLHSSNHSRNRAALPALPASVEGLMQGKWRAGMELMGLAERSRELAEFDSILLLSISVQ